MSTASPSPTCDSNGPLKAPCSALLNDPSAPSSPQVKATAMGARSPVVIIAPTDSPAAPTVDSKREKGRRVLLPLGDVAADRLLAAVKGTAANGDHLGLDLASAVIRHHAAARRVVVNLGIVATGSEKARAVDALTERIVATLTEERGRTPPATLFVKTAHGRSRLSPTTDARQARDLARSIVAGTSSLVVAFAGPAGQAVDQERRHDLARRFLLDGPSFKPSAAIHDGAGVVATVNPKALQIDAANAITRMVDEANDAHRNGAPLQHHRIEADLTRPGDHAIPMSHRLAHAVGIAHHQATSHPLSPNLAAFTSFAMGEELPVSKYGKLYQDLREGLSVKPAAQAATSGTVPAASGYVMEITNAPTAAAA